MLLHDGDIKASGQFCTLDSLDRALGGLHSTADELKSLEIISILAIHTRCLSDLVHGGSYNSEKS